MFRVDFKKFWQLYQKEKSASRKPSVFYEVTPTAYTFYFKNWEYWEFYTEVDKTTIISFGEMQGMTPEVAIEQFEIEYCRGNMQLREYSVTDIEPEPLDVRVDKLVEAGEGVVDESINYDEFLSRKVNYWENVVVHELERTPFEKQFDYDKKRFNALIRVIMNTVTSLSFYKMIRTYIKRSVLEGVDSAEEEIGINIDIGPLFDDKVNALADQQLEGYMINGKPWYGIKGATRQLQHDILKTVEEGVRNKLSKKEVIQNVKEVFKGSTMASASRIARTETTRFVAEGKLLGYKNSGIEGGKVYEAVMDENTSDLCRRLHNKYFNNPIGFDEEFIDPETHKGYQYPPSHPNCRCTIQFRKNNVV